VAEQADVRDFERLKAVVANGTSELGQCWRRADGRRSGSRHSAFDDAVDVMLTSASEGTVIIASLPIDGGTALGSAESPTSATVQTFRAGITQQPHKSSSTPATTTSAELLQSRCGASSRDRSSHGGASRCDPETE